MGALGSGPIGALGAAIHLIFHDLRHEAASRLGERGFSVMEVGAVTGHKTLPRLKRWYTHFGPRIWWGGWRDYRNDARTDAGVHICRLLL